MFLRLLKSILRYYANEKGKFIPLYLRICNPEDDEYTNFLRRHGRFNFIGKNTYITKGANITDPEYVRLGNNVILSKCTLLGHDGVVSMLDRAYNVKLDSVGKVDIKDNVFIGYDAIIMPGVTIGPNAIVAAGAVVTKDVLEGDIVAGVPAKSISRVDDLVTRLQASTDVLPWVGLIKTRDFKYDPKVEQELIAMRVKYFYPNN